MKRYLSLILVVTMLFGLFPCITFASGDASVIIDFTTETSINHDKNDSVAALAGEGFTTVKGETTTIKGKYSARSYYKQGFGVKLIHVSTGATPWLSDGGENEKWTIEVDFGNATSGWYDVSLLAGKSNTASAWYIYVDGQYAGFYDSYDASATGVPKMNPDGEIKLNSLYLTPDDNGKVKVMFAPVDKSVYDGVPRLIISSMTFTPTTAPDMESLSLSVTKPEMMLVGDVEDIEAKVKMSDGTVYRLNGYKANREPDTENYLAVSSGNPDVASLTGVMSDGIYNGKLSAQGEGETTLDVIGKVCGKQVSATVPIKVIVPSGPVKMTIDMTKNSIVYADKTAPSDAWKTTGFSIVFDKTTTCNNSRYTPHEVNGVGVATIATNTNKKAPDDVWPASTAEISQNAMFTIKKRSYGEGYYAVYVQGSKWYANSDYAIYVNGQYAGDYNFNKADASSAVLGERKRLNTVYLPAGDVEISFRVRKKMYDVSFFQPYLVELVPIDVQEAPYVLKVESDAPETIYVGEKAEITAKVLMSDGSYRSFGLADNGSTDTASCVTSVTSSDVGVATVENVESAMPVTSDEITFTVNAVAKGNAKALVAINIAGQEPCVKEIPIKIIEKPKLSKVDLAFSVSQIAVGNVGETSVTLTRDDGSAWPEEDGYEVSYESLTPEYASVNPETGVITGVSVGIAEIQATVTAYDGTEISGKATIEITPEPLDKTVTIDFTTAEKIGYSKDPAIQTTPRQVKGKGFAAVAVETTEKSGQGSAREFNHSFGVELIGIETKETPWLSAGGEMEKWTAEINLGTAKPGWYSLSFLGGKWASGASWYIYADGQYAGFYDSYDASVTGVPVINPDGETKLNSIYLAPDETGRVKVMFALAEARKNVRPYILLSKMTFKPVNIDESKTILRATVPQELVVGEKNVITARIILSDETERLVNGYASDRSADTSNCILASVEGESVSIEDSIVDEAYLGKLSALSDGESTVTLKAVLNGSEVKTETYNIPVRTEGLASTGAKPEGNGIGVGETARLVAEPRIANGRVLSAESVSSTYRSLDEKTATIEGDVITAKKAGTVDVEVTSTFNGKETVGVSTITIFEGRIVKLSATSGGSQYIRLTDKENDTVPIYVTATDHLGKEYAVENENISSVALTKDIADIDEKNNIIPKKVGDAEFEVTVNVNGSIHTERVTLSVVKGKAKATYRPEEMVQAARENYKKYDWVKSNAETYVKIADKYVSRLDDLYNMIASQGIPRSHSLGAKNDPEMYICRFCNADLMALRGQFPWVHNALSRPWKVQCPECKRVFPSNDFEKFYELGLNEYREFDRMRALEAHRELFGDKSVTEPGAEHSAQWKKYYGYGVPGGYLTNKMYKTIDDTANGGKGLREGETVETWGVDDSMGYVPAKADGTLYEYVDEKGNVLATERHIYIAEYMHTAVFYWISGEDGAVSEAIRNCALAYFYTGDKQYGRVAAILLDRIADFYHEYDLSVYGNKVWNADGGAEKGKMTGRIWESGNAVELATAYDIVFDMYEDEYVLNYIKEKSNTIKMRHAKNTASQLRTNIEDGILRPALEGLIDTSVSGNFGYPQTTNAVCAVVLDTYPETAEWIDYLMAPGWRNKAPCPGGGIISQLVDVIDADGQGDEGSDYNIDWHRALIKVTDSLDIYGYEDGNLYNNPKFLQMFYSMIPLMGAYTPSIGDSGSTLRRGHWMSEDVALAGWRKIKDPIFAQILYLLNGNTAEGLHYADTERNPERLEDEVREVIETYGEFVPQSHVMTNFGFAALRNGVDYTNNITDPTTTDTRRDVWMYFGTNDGHAHDEVLNLGMTAFGLDFLPDNGYPETTGTQPNRLQWVSTALSHNTVMVNERSQDTNAEARGEAHHFDLGEKVQVMDVSANYLYPEIDEYRRSVITVEVDDANSYTVDFFRVLGGNDHLYSFHATSNEIRKYSGLEFETVYDENGVYVTGSQVDENGEYKGSYAGIDVPFGPDPNSPAEWAYETIYPRGYTWIENVDRDNTPAEKVELDFKITDFKKSLKDSSGLGLHMTVFNGGNMKGGVKSEFSIADAYPPRKGANKQIDKFKYVLIKHSGENLDTTYTTVLEPYKQNRYLKSADELALTSDKPATAGSAARALRIEHINGRVDYVFYSTDNTVTYTVTDGSRDINFRGFVGVYSIQNGVNVYKYVCDGDIIGENTGKKAGISATIKSFTDTLEEENYITITPSAPVSDEEISDLSGRFVFVDNGDAVRSGTWEIKGARRSNSDIVLDVGRITTIRKHANASLFSAGYKYIIEKGQDAYIPLSFADDNAPEFVSLPSGISTNAGSSVSVSVVAKNPTGEAEGEITYSLKIAPRGASIDKNSGTILWNTNASQVGRNHFAVTATDALGREGTGHFYIEVYGSTSGKPEKPNDTTKPETNGTGGGSGGAGTTTPAEPTTPTVPTEPEKDVRFVDLGNHAWAESSINALADEGIIKGTSENTFSPANNITRADFAILLVRAFKLESDNTENFSDVSDSDYFAKELAIARNEGIVGGIGDNKYAPEDFITRQDMMVIVYRALTKLGVELQNADVSYDDFTDVADYAEDAVKALITNGLVNGKSGKIAPTEYTTRAEVAVLLKRILDYTSK